MEYINLKFKKCRIISYDKTGDLFPEKFMDVESNVLKCDHCGTYLYENKNVVPASTNHGVVMFCRPCITIFEESGV